MRLFLNRRAYVDSFSRSSSPSQSFTGGGSAPANEAADFSSFCSMVEEIATATKKASASLEGSSSGCCGGGGAYERHYGLETAAALADELRAAALKHREAVVGRGAAAVSGGPELAWL